VARMEEERKMYKFLVGKPKGSSSIGRLRRRWKDGIRMDLGENGWGWTGFSWLRIGTKLGSCECGDEHSVSSATELVLYGR
jgi:hypothetical protein